MTIFLVVPEATKVSRWGKTHWFLILTSTNCQLHKHVLQYHSSFILLLKALCSFIYVVFPGLMAVCHCKCRHFFCNFMLELPHYPGLVWVFTHVLFFLQWEWYFQYQPISTMSYEWLEYQRMKCCKSSFFRYFQRSPAMHELCASREFSKRSVDLPSVTASFRTFQSSSQVVVHTEKCLVSPSSIVEPSSLLISKTLILSESLMNKSLKTNL